jgi:predicted DNA-binding protein (MmcQ/YjbR family)
MEEARRVTKGRAMTPADVEKFLLALPHATLSIQWGNDRVFKIAGKMFAVLGPHEEKNASMSFKAAEESFRILTELPGIKPAPYLARAHWVWLDKPTRLPVKDLKAYLTRAHAIIASGLPKKKQAEMGLSGPASPAPEKKTKATPKQKDKRKKS